MARPTPPEPIITLDPRLAMRWLRRGMVPALVLALVAGSVAFFLTSNQAPTYRASVVVVALASSMDLGTATVLTAPAVSVDTYRTAIVDGAVLARALEVVSGRSPDAFDLRRTLNALRIQVSDQQVSGTVRIEYVHTDAAYAAALVDQIASELAAWDRDRATVEAARVAANLEADLIQLDAAIAATTNAALAQRLNTERAGTTDDLAYLQTVLRTGAFGTRVAVIDPARVPQIPVGPRTVLQTLVATMLGLLVGLGGSWARETLDPRVSRVVLASDALGAPALAAYPGFTRRDYASAREAASLHRQNLVRALDTGPEGLGHVIAITCAEVDDAEDRRAVASFLAESFANAGHRVLVVDADLRHAGLSEAFDVVASKTVTLEERLRGRSAVTAPLVVTAGPSRTFEFVPSHASAEYPADLLAAGIQRLLAAWTGEYDIVLVDAPPVGPYADALVVAEHTDHVAVVARIDQTGFEAVRGAIRALSHSGTRSIGVVVTRVRGSQQAVRIVTSESQPSATKAGAPRQAVPRRESLARSEPRAPR